MQVCISTKEAIGSLYLLVQILLYRIANGDLGIMNEQLKCTGAVHVAGLLLSADEGWGPSMCIVLG